jgi:hypothetical protein
MNILRISLLFFLTTLFSSISFCQTVPEVIILGLNKEHGWHYFNTKGELLLKAKDEIYYFSEDLLVREEKKAWGFVDCHGAWKIHPQYNSVKLFSEGFAAVEKDNQWFYIDKNGNVTNGSFEAAKPFSEGIAAVKINGKWGYIDTTGNLVVPPEYITANDFANGIAGVEQSKNKWFFVDKKGNTAISVNKDYTFVGQYSSNLIRVRTGEVTDNLHVKWGFVDSTGRKVIPSKFNDVADFSEGLARAKEADLWGYILSDGDYLIIPQFKDARDFKDGYARVNVDGKWGVIDKKGTWICNPAFHYLGEFFDGVAAAEVKVGWGLIDINGNWILKPEYKYIKRVMPSLCK